MNRQRDAVGLTAFNEKIVTRLPASARPGTLRALLLALDRLELGEETNIAEPLHHLADTMPKRGMVVLISDLLDEPGRVIRGLKHLQFRGTDVIVFQVLDVDEIEFPFESGDAVSGPGNERRGPGGAGGGARSLPQRNWRTDRTVPVRAGRFRNRLSPAQYRHSRSRSRCSRTLHAFAGDVMVSFFAPLFLVGAVAAAVPIILHLFMRQPEVRLRFAAVKLLRQAPVEHTARRRLRDWLLLALRVAALVLLSLAFARPFLTAVRLPAQPA